MKIIEALKTLKANKKKVNDLIEKIKQTSAFLSNQTSPYGDQAATKAVVEGWLDSVRQTLRDNEVLTNRIHRTNVVTVVPIEVTAGFVIEKTIDEWLTRRKEGVDLHEDAFLALTDRGLRETFVQQPNGENIPVTIVRNYDARARDTALATFAEEKGKIDSALEIVNATTDLVE